MKNFTSAAAAAVLLTSLCTHGESLPPAPVNQCDVPQPLSQGQDKKVGSTWIEIQPIGCSAFSLPQIGAEVLMYCNGLPRMYSLGRFIGTASSATAQPDRSQCTNVTHWMALPASPEQKDLLGQ